MWSRNVVDHIDEPSCWYQSCKGELWVFLWWITCLRFLSVLGEVDLFRRWASRRFCWVQTSKIWSSTFFWGGEGRKNFHTPPPPKITPQFPHFLVKLREKSKLRSPLHKLLRMEQVQRVLISCTCPAEALPERPGSLHRSCVKRLSSTQEAAFRLVMVKEIVRATMKKLLDTTEEVCIGNRHTCSSWERERSVPFVLPKREERGSRDICVCVCLRERERENVEPPRNGKKPQKLYL